MNNEDKDFMAFELALGLVTKNDIEIDIKLQHKIDFWKKKATNLNIYAPLTKKQSKTIWQNINKEITVKKPTIAQIVLSKLIMWQYVIPIVMLLAASILFVPNLMQKTSPWLVQKDIHNSQIIITTLKDVAMPKNKVCYLWLKNKDKTILLGKLSNNKGSKKIIIINEKIAEVLKNSKILISIEEKDSMIIKPTQIDFIEDWS